MRWIAQPLLQGNGSETYVHRYTEMGGVTHSKLLPWVLFLDAMTIINAVRAHQHSQIETIPTVMDDSRCGWKPRHHEIPGQIALFVTAGTLGIGGLI